MILSRKIWESSGSAGCGQPHRSSEEFDGTRSCCLRHGVARNLRERGMVITHPHVLTWLVCWAISQHHSLSDTERSHSYNRRFCKMSNGTTTWDQLASFAVNAASRYVLNAGQRRIDSAPSAPPQLALADGVDGEAVATNEPLVKNRRRSARQPSLVPTPKPPKGKSAFEVFRSDYINDQRALALAHAGSVRNPCSKEFWDEVKALCLRPLCISPPLSTTPSFFLALRHGA
jgi:hypothetical protein